MTRRMSVALVLMLVLAPISQAYAQLVTRVIDGDTLIVQACPRGASLVSVRRRILTTGC